MQQTAYARMVYERRARRRTPAPIRTRRSVRSILQHACRKIVAFLFTQVR